MLIDSNYFFKFIQKLKLGFCLLCAKFEPIIPEPNIIIMVKKKYNPI